VAKRNDTLPPATASWLISISKISRASPSLVELHRAHIIEKLQAQPVGLDPHGDNNEFQSGRLIQ
jgi:hypothetical protein